MRKKKYEMEHDNEDLSKIRRSILEFRNNNKSSTSIRLENDVQATESKRVLKTQDNLRKVLIESFETPRFKSMVKIFYSPHILLKIFLFTFSLASTVYPSYLAIQSVEAYLAYEVTTKSRTFYETPMLFPKITFCNLNMLTTAYAYKQIVESSSDMNFSNEQKKLFGHSLEDILLKCVYNNGLCDAHDFVWSYDSQYGNCYTFNALDSNGSAASLKKSSFAGPAFGLILTLYVNYYEKFAETIDTLGVIIWLGNSSYLTDSNSGEDGILVSPGSFTSIAVKREFKSLQPKPYSNCELVSNVHKFIQGLDLYNLITTSGYLYTQQLCFFQCYQKYFIDSFNCSSRMLPSLFNASQCNEFYFFFEEFNDDFISKHCISSCPLECEKLSLRASLSSGQLNGNSYYVDRIKNNPNLAEDFLNRTIDSQTTKESLVNVKIFYESLSYTLTNESPQMDAVYLLGSIGGNLGLFLGISVFSKCEVIEAVIEIILFLRKRNNIDASE
jgi:hypothetical protein